MEMIGALPLFVSFADKVPCKGPALDPRGGPDPLDSHARIRSLVSALRAFLFLLLQLTDFLIKKSGFLLEIIPESVEFKRSRTVS